MFSQLFKIFYRYFFYIILIILASSCSSVSTKTGRGDINDVIFLPGQTTERKIAEGKNRKGSFLDNLFSKKSANTRTAAAQFSFKMLKDLKKQRFCRKV